MRSTLLQKLLRVVHDAESRRLLERHLQAGHPIGSVLWSVPCLPDRRAAAVETVRWLAFETRSPALELTRSLLEVAHSPSTLLHLCRTGLTLRSRPRWALAQVARELLACAPPRTLQGRQEAARLALRALEGLLTVPETAARARLGLAVVRALPEWTSEIVAAVVGRPFENLASACLELLDALRGGFGEVLSRAIVEALSESYQIPEILIELELARQSSLDELRPLVRQLAA